MSLVPLIPGSEGTRAESAMESRAMILRYFEKEQGAGSGRAATRLACRNQYDMKPPVDPAVMARNNKRHLPNADWGEHRRMVDESVTPVHRVRLGSRRPAQLQLKDTYNPDRVLSRKHGRYLSDCYGQLLRHWGGRSTQEELSSKWMVMFGCGPMYFPFRWSWQYRAVDPKDVLLPDGAKVDPEEWNWFAIADTLPLHDLSALLDAPESAEGLGWNVSAVRALFANREKLNPNAGEQGANDSTSIEERAQAVKRRDLYETYKDGSGNGLLKIFHFYVRESDGKWSQFLLLRDNVDVKAVDEAYLFQDLRAYDSALDVLVPTTLDSGEGTWHSLRGLSVRIHKFCEASNSAKNHAIAVTKLLGGLLLQPAAGSDLRKVQEITLSDPITLIPPGFQAINQGIPNPTGGLLEIDRIMQELRDRNVAQFGTGAPDVAKDRPVGTARLDFARSAELKEADRDNLYKWLERLHVTVVARIVRIITDEDSPVKGAEQDLDEDKLAIREAKSPGYRLLHKHFIRRAQVRFQLPSGVFAELDPDVTMARRQVGDGNPAVLEAKMQQLTPLKAEMSAVSIAAFNRHIFDSVLGPDLADEFFPDAIPAEEIDQRHAASLEHASLALGIYIPVATTDNHIVHIQTHLQWAEQTYGEYQQGLVGKSDAYRRIRAVEIHVLGQEDGGHLGRLLSSEDLKPVAETFNRRVDALRKISNQLGQELAAEAEAAQKQAAERAAVPAQTAREQVMLQESATRQQIQQLEAIASAQAKIAKAVGQNQTKTEQAQTKAELDRLRIQLDHEVQRLRAQLEADVKREGARNADGNASQ